MSDKQANEYANYTALLVEEIENQNGSLFDNWNDDFNYYHDYNIRDSRYAQAYNEAKLADVY